MPRRLALTGPYRAEFMSYRELPLEPRQVRVKTELASGKVGTTMAVFENRTFGGERFEPNMRIFVPDESESAQHGPRPDTPWAMGTTAVGTVTEVGSEVLRTKPGERVFGLMDVSETNTVDESDVYALGGIAPLTALCLEPAYVSFHSLRESNLRYGDAVAVVGLGALGLLAVGMARQAGAETVIAIDPLESRRLLALSHGADHSFDPRSQDVALEVHKVTAGKGVDVAIELAGTYPALEAAIRCVRVGGTVCAAGFYQGEANTVFFGREWHHNRLTMIVPHGCGWGHPPRDYPRWDTARAYDAIVSMMRKGRLDAAGIINLTVPFEQGGSLFDLLMDRPGQVIKYAVQF